MDPRFGIKELKKCYLQMTFRAEEMAQQLRAFTALAEAPNPVSANIQLFTIA